MVFLLENRRHFTKSLARLEHESGDVSGTFAAKIGA